jgi:hypothetical protein
LGAEIGSAARESGAVVAARRNPESETRKQKLGTTNQKLETEDGD